MSKFDINTVLDKINQKGKLTEKETQKFHDQIMEKGELENIWANVVTLKKAKVLDDQDLEVLYEELLQSHDRLNLYEYIFEALSQKVLCVPKKELEEIKKEVLNIAPVEYGLDMVYHLKDTKYLTKEEAEVVAIRVLNEKNPETFAEAIEYLGDLDIWELEDYEMMWDICMSVGETQTCVEVALALSEEDVAEKKDIELLFDECAGIVENTNLKDAGEITDAEDALVDMLDIVNAYYDKKFISPKMVQRAKAIVLEVGKVLEEDEIEYINFLANATHKNIFEDAELQAAKKRFMKQIKDTVLLKQGEVEIINQTAKESKKQNQELKPHIDAFNLPNYSPLFEENVINWQEVFSKADKKTLKTLAIETKNPIIYQIFVLVADEEIEELEEFFATCDCCECGCEHCDCECC